jgi:hypothetical protein
MMDDDHLAPLNVREQIQREIIAKLAQGITVTLTCNDRVVAIYYPDGRIEQGNDL